MTSPLAGHPSLSPAALDELSADLISVLHTTLPERGVEPGLVVVPGCRRWVCLVDAVLLRDAGNVGDVLWAAVRAALCDTRVPRTWPLDYYCPLPSSAAADGEACLDIWSSPSHNKHGIQWRLERRLERRT
jgi:hypothetical protein